jgi:hypothetical protein
MTNLGDGTDVVWLDTDVKKSAQRTGNLKCASRQVHIGQGAEITIMTQNSPYIHPLTMLA